MVQLWTTFLSVKIKHYQENFKHALVIYVKNHEFCIQELWFEVLKLVWLISDGPKLYRLTVFDLSYPRFYQHQTESYRRFTAFNTKVSTNPLVQICCWIQTLLCDSHNTALAILSLAKDRNCYTLRKSIAKIFKILQKFTATFCKNGKILQFLLMFGKISSIWHFFAKLLRFWPIFSGSHQNMTIFGKKFVNITKEC